MTAREAGTAPRRHGVVAACIAAALLALGSAGSALADAVDIGSSEEVEESTAELCVSWYEPETGRTASVSLCVTRDRDVTQVDVARSISTTEEIDGGARTSTDRQRWYGDLAGDVLTIDREANTAYVKAQLNASCAIDLPVRLSGTYAGSSSSGLADPWLARGGLEVRERTSTYRYSDADAAGNVCGWPEAQNASEWGDLYESEERARVTSVRPDWDASNVCTDGPAGRVEAGDCAA